MGPSTTAIPRTQTALGLTPRCIQHDIFATPSKTTVPPIATGRISSLVTRRKNPGLGLIISLFLSQMGVLSEIISLCVF